MRRSISYLGRLKGFTLIELLVVVAIIALLISILLPSLSRARKQAQGVACMSNMDQVHKALRMYQDEFKGWAPQSDNPSNPYQPGSLWSEAAWGVSKKDLWFYKLVPTYCGNPKAFVCPGDPFAQAFDFEAQPVGGQPRTDLSKATCGYGMNYGFRHWGSNLMNLDGKKPRRPEATILLAEVGPDDQLVAAPLYATGVGDVGLAYPWRDGGRLLWDDGNRPWYTGPTWLTARHLGKINMSAMDYSVKSVSTVTQLREGPIATRIACRGPYFPGGGQPQKYVCHLCSQNVPHYLFYTSGLWWWTGNPAEIK